MGDAERLADPLDGWEHLAALDRVRRDDAVDPQVHALELSVHQDRQGEDCECWIIAIAAQVAALFRGFLEPEEGNQPAPGCSIHNI